jgi:ATP-dependent Clp protease ATP-binding subunit ClpC
MVAVMLFSNFTEKARNAINAAHDIACGLGHDYIGSEHILAGLAREKTGMASKVMAKANITDETIIEKIKQLVGTGEPYDKQSELSLTPRSKRILEISAMEAQRLGHTYIGTEHILMAVVRDGEGVGARILASFNINPSAFYAETVRAVNPDASDGYDYEYEGGETPSANYNPNSKTPTLDKFGRDFTAMSKDGRFDPVIGRDEEIERVIQILSRRTKNNPCLIGEPGVGKTAIAEGLAQKITDSDVPEILKNKRLVTLDLSSMVAGAKYRGEFEERMKKAIEEVVQSGNIILFIDEIHTIVGAGSAEGSIDAANILKPALARGELQLIGATTIKEYRKYIEKDAALERRFQPVTVGEPSQEEAVRILNGIRDKYEAHHGVNISDEAIEAAVELSSRYITDRFLPDKAIDLIDEAASKKRLSALTAPADVKDLEKQLEAIAKDKEEAITSQDFEKAAELRDKENDLKAQMEKDKTEWKDKQTSSNLTVEAEDVADVVSGWTKIPVKQLTQTESERLKNLESLLHERVVGQDAAVTAVSKAIRRGRAGLKDPKRPIGSFLFLGPTGVGKTELSKALAECMFGSEDAMIRVDMSEYMEKHAVSKFIGSPPGYVGYEEGGQLTEKIRKKPYSVLLFDEIEKAHPDVFNIMLQILEDGILTDAQGRKVDFRNTIIIMTSNLGAKNILQMNNSRLGFSKSDGNGEQDDFENIKEKVMAEVKREFKPEFLNRIDDIIVFSRLSENDIKEIASIMLSSLKRRLNGNDISVEFSDGAVTKLAKAGYDPTFGARPLRRAIQNEVEDLLSEEIIDGKIKKGDSVTVDIEDDKLVVR